MLDVIFSIRLIQEYFEKCEHLFALDPLLLRVVICICPDKDLNYLFERIPPFLSTTWLANRTWFIGGLNKHEASAYGTTHAYLFFELANKLLLYLRAFFQAQEWIMWLEYIKKLITGKTQEGESE